MASLVRRGKTYYAQYYLGKKQKRVNLHTDSLQVAKEKLRQLGSALFLGDDLPLPTRTPLPKLLEAYVGHLQASKGPKNVGRNISYLRAIFGPAAPCLAVKNPRISAKSRKRPSKRPELLIEIACLEDLTTRAVVEFIAAKVRDTGIKAKTANHYREILTRLCNWAMKQYGVRMPGGKNPAAAAERYRESPPEIVFLSREEIELQLQALSHRPQLQAMVALYIYAGLRREEGVWLTCSDVDLAA